MKPSSQNTALFERAQRVLPGGVSSPVRAFRAVGGTPLYYESGEGAYFVDADGERYLDFVCSWGPLILGHAHPRVTEAVQEATRRGTSFGAPCRDEVELAELVCSWYPACEMLRFTSSGTEACMSAIRVARGATGRDRILKFSGCYHGHSDGLLVAAGSGLVTFGKPSSAGVPEDFTRWTSVLPLDDDAALEAFFAEYGDELAVAVIEPVPANNGLLVQRPAYLKRLRELCSKHGALLLFDEVITGFRLGKTGAAGLYGIEPDLACFGKVIGGGMPVGAFGGSREVMSQLAPLGPVYQAGTLSGNPVAMAAGLACLRELEESDAWSQLQDLSERLLKQLSSPGLPFGFVSVGSLFWLGPAGDHACTRAESIPQALAEFYAGLHQRLLEAHIYLAPSAYEVGFLSTAHSEDDVDRLAEVLCTP